MDGGVIGLVFREEWVNSGDIFWYGDFVSEFKVIDGEAGSTGECGAIGVLGVVGTKLGPADGADDTPVGVKSVGRAEVDVKLIGGGTEPYDQLH